MIGLMSCFAGLGPEPRRHRRCSRGRSLRSPASLIGRGLEQLVDPRGPVEHGSTRCGRADGRSCPARWARAGNQTWDWSLDAPPTAPACPHAARRFRSHATRRVTGTAPAVGVTAGAVGLEPLTISSAARPAGHGAGPARPGSSAHRWRDVCRGTGIRLGQCRRSRRPAGATTDDEGSGGRSRQPRARTSRRVMHADVAEQDQAGHDGQGDGLAPPRTARSKVTGRGCSGRSSQAAR